MGAELWMAALGCGQSVGSAEAFFVGQLLPGCIILVLSILSFKQTTVPGHVADGLAHLG